MKDYKRLLKKIYLMLLEKFGPQGWWPGDSAFEIMVGAILTQNTNWQNVSRAIKNLKKEKALSAQKLYSLPLKKLASLIKPAGYYNIKAKRLKNFLDFFFKNYQGDIRLMAKKDLAALRHELLSVNGIGEETADSILLYALNKPIFVVDAYTRRIFSRHKFLAPDATYTQTQGLFMQNLKADTKIFNEYHALIVRLGKDFCRKSKPRCLECPLNQ
ncbi:MAG: endonuclease III domain-containing protein [Candidatus Omnitrophica bacterium]|nr:endonuclease III domain-containing protein [Candidatus Omnitrophota bacterium]